MFILNPDLRIRKDGCRYILWPSLPLIKGIGFFHKVLFLDEALVLFLFAKGAKPEWIKTFLAKLHIEVPSDFARQLLINPNHRFKDMPDLPVLIPCDNFIPLTNYDLNKFIGKNQPTFEMWHYARVSFPLSIVHVVNYRCNGNCDYCYAPQNEKTQYIDLEILKLRIEEWAEEGVSDVTLTGGDIFLHPKIKEMVYYYLQTPIEIAVSTKSGYPPWFLEMAKESKQLHLQISLDVLPGRAAEKLYAAPDFPLKALYAIDKLEDYKIPYQIHTVIARQNINFVMELINHVLKKHPKSIKRWVFSPVARSGQRGGSSYRPPSREKYELLEKEIEQVLLNAEFPFSASFAGNQYENMESFLKRAYCSGNRTTFVVLPSGLVTLCEELYDNPMFILGDLRENTSREIWFGNRAKELFFVEDARLIGSICGNCEYREKCLVDLGKCWKFAMRAFGEENFSMPQPDCPKAPRGRKIGPFS